MRVLVFQSHSPKAPAWISRCTAGVRRWAAANGYDYRWLGDELFDDLPPAIARKAKSRLPLSDLGRLLWARRLLDECDCILWIDADVLIFDPPALTLDFTQPHLVCRELLVRRGATIGSLSVMRGVNPTVLMFRRDSSLLPLWIDEALRHGCEARGLGEADLGRNLLARLATEPPPAVENVGHFNAAVLKDLYYTSGPALPALMQSTAVPLAAANLCGHYPLPPLAFERIIDRLTESRGAVVNRYFSSWKGS